jgi:RNA polymerase sigma-70 factor (ECF subfamily)
MGSECASFERVYDEHWPAVYRVAYRVLANPAQAQDVVQDVFLKVWRRPADFDESRGTLGNYLRLMARSRALDMWRDAQVAARARSRMRVLAMRDEGRAADRPAVAAEMRRDRTIVLDALAHLPEVQRQAIMMAYWGGLTADQIAARCDVPVGTVKSRIRLGIIKLRDLTAVELAAGSRQAAA